jgi:hypothetical protein
MSKEEGHIMCWKPLNKITILVLLVGMLLAAVGCNEKNGTRTVDMAAKTGVAKAEDKKDGASKHSGWWCDEHGVPEAMCGQCDAKLAAAFKKKGDWCNEHDRPDSQCFIHHPELKEKFAAVYRAKYGREPPPMEEEPKQDQKN